MKAVLVTALVLLFAGDAIAQIPLARLEPSSPAGSAKFGEQVGISGDNVFVMTSKDPADPDGAVIKVFERHDDRWVSAQTLAAPGFSGTRGFDHFYVSGDLLAAAADEVLLYRRERGSWRMMDVPVHPSTGRNVGVEFLDERFLVLTRYKKGGDPAFVNEVFQRDGESLEAVGVLPEYSYRMCMAGGDAVQSVYVEAPYHDPTTGELRISRIEALVISSLRNGEWVVTQTIVPPGGEIDELACDGDRIVATHSVDPTLIDPRVEPEDVILTIAQRRDDGRWGVEQQVDITEHGIGVMALELYGDHLYVGREFHVPDSSKSLGYVVLSEIRMYERRDAEWEFFRTIEHPDEFDPSWLGNDGCIGAAIQADGDLIVASAPIRDRRVGLRRVSQVGEVLIYSLGELTGAPVSTETSSRDEGLGANVYPNPGRGMTTFAYTLPAAAAVRAEIFDALGRRVAALAGGARSAGLHKSAFDSRDWAPGVYFLRLSADHGAPHVSRFVVAR